MKQGNLEVLVPRTMHHTTNVGTVALAGHNKLPQQPLHRLKHAAADLVKLILKLYRFTESLPNAASRAAREHLYEI